MSSSQKPTDVFASNFFPAFRFSSLVSSGIFHLIVPTYVSFSINKSSTSCLPVTTLSAVTLQPVLYKLCSLFTSRDG